MPDSTQISKAIMDHPLGDGFSLEGHLTSIRREYLRRAMEEAGGVKAQATRLLGMDIHQTLLVPPLTALWAIPWSGEPSLVKGETISHCPNNKVREAIPKL